MTNGTASETNVIPPEVALLPCPFCGGEAELYSTVPTYDSFWCCICRDCGASTSFGSEAEAIAAWNTRAEDAATVEMAQRIQSLESECAKLQEELRKAGDRGTLTAEQVRENNSCAECAEGMGRYADSICDPLKQRIAELEEQRDVLLHCLENDWHIRASWDGLRKFWCIELTEEGVKLRDATHGTLTAKQVRGCAERVYLEGYSDGSVNRGAHIEETDWQAIADELNKALGVGECELVYGENDDGVDGWYTHCGGWFAATRKDRRLVQPGFCQLCGGKAVKR